MNKNEINELYDDSIRLWGEDAQIDMMIEECSELIKALCKNKRRPKSFEVLYNVCEELTDVEIVLDHMKIIFDIEGKQSDKIREEKLMKLKRKVDKLKENEE